jgi:hypothetical protein
MNYYTAMMQSFEREKNKRAYDDHGWRGSGHAFYFYSLEMAPA